MTRLANVEQFAAKRENTEVVSAHHAQSSNCESFGRISFSEDQGAVTGVLRSGIVSISQFG